MKILMYGKFTAQFCVKKDNDRISVMERKSKIENKNRRKRLRAVKKGFSDRDEENEGVVYGAGLF